jgi:hypothetical protein
MLIEPDQQNLVKQRNQQSNFETILQIIGLRCQPENITDPVQRAVRLDSDIWGTNYKSKSPVKCWSFVFEVQQPVIYHNETGPLGNLYQDCEGVPMIINLDEWNQIESVISSNKQTKNIHFEIENG